MDERIHFMDTSFGGRQPLLKDDLGWKTTFSERRPVVEDDLQWKTTFSGRRPLLDPCMLENILNFMYHFLGTAGFGAYILIRG